MTSDIIDVSTTSDAILSVPEQDEGQQCKYSVTFRLGEISYRNWKHQQRKPICISVSSILVAFEIFYLEDIQIPIDNNPSTKLLKF